MVSNIFIATGLSILEIAANPFIALAGPEDLMESRLNFSQGLQTVGSVIAQLLASKVIFKDASKIELLNTQWVFLAVALWSSFLGAVFYYVPLSEASDTDLELVALRREAKRGSQIERKIWRVNIIGYMFVTGIFFMFLYIGAQEYLWYIWDDLIRIFKPA